jgi:hypothetical protein
MVYDKDSYNTEINISGYKKELFRFGTYRPWVFRQVNIGGDVRLDLHSTVGSKSFQITGAGEEIYFMVRAQENMKTVYLVPDGGTVDIGGTLKVNGSVVQKGTKLHADYVFDSDYKLESIEDHANEMFSNGHLKAVPKAKQDENGQDVVEYGSHLKGILEELEKAHIYIHKLNETIKQLNETSKQQQQVIANMSQRLSELEQQ